MLLCAPLFWGIFRSAYHTEYVALFFGVGLLTPILLLIYIRMLLFGKINKRHLTVLDWIRG